ncbi:MAG TPA: sulfite reductase [Gammaproteobacteria bacterium]|nr:sulfite reductase [Gammaproteobacteria bacterium]
MYVYDEYDQRLVDERVAQFRDQTRRYLAGELSEDEYRPLRLRNGLYVQRHAPMLRVSIPYGLLSSAQLRMLAHVARRYDRGYGHFSTRQNIQYNWPKIEEVPDLLADLASVQMHAVQTSGNCIRNITADHLAGVAADEIEDPRPWCELVRQWSTFHPEFYWLPRKFKIAFSGAMQDRAAVMVHDIGLYIVRNDAGLTGFRVVVGGGLGRTAILGAVIREFLPAEHLLPYLEAILRIYNLEGRRDNIYKARIKILVKAMGAETFAERVEAEFQHTRNEVPFDWAEYRRIARHFSPPSYDPDAVAGSGVVESLRAQAPAFDRWVTRNVKAHKVPGYRVVMVSLKAPELPPGDCTAEQMDLLADLADRFSFSEVRSTHDQNLLLADVREGDLPEVWRALDAARLATPNIGTLTDMICCPGLDFCSLANAGSIPIAQQLNDRFSDLDYLYDLGEIQVKMSGCMNACGHHHLGHIGILGVDKHGLEFYQITLGGSATADACLGDRLGPAIAKSEVAECVARILDVYVEHRNEDESFLHCYRRIGIDPFKSRVYADVTREEGSDVATAD